MTGEFLFGNIDFFFLSPNYCLFRNLPPNNNLTQYIITKVAHVLDFSHSVKFDNQLLKKLTMLTILLMCT